MALADRINVLNTTFSQLEGPLVFAYEQSIPFLDELNKRAKRKVDGGTYIERDISAGASARGTGIYNGNERLTRQYRERVRKYQVEPHRLVAILEIPKKDLMLNTGNLGVIKLIESHPKETVLAAAQDFNKYLLTGQSQGLVFATADLQGFVTLNGQFASGVGLGVANGLLDFATPATQTDTVQNVAKSTTIYHYNQYGAITTWATNGYKTLKDTYRKCAAFSSNPMNGGPTLLIMDFDVFANYEETQDAKIRTVAVNDATSKDTTMVLKFLNGVAYPDLHLDRSLFTGAAANGVTYLLNSEYFEMVYHQEPTIGKFEDSGPDYDTVYAKFEQMGNLICKKFPAQGVVSGGAA